MGKNATGATNITGNVSGPAMLDIVNGRVNFYGNVGNAGGLRIGESGYSSDFSFLGTASGSVPLTIMGGGGNYGTTVRYATGALPTGLISVQMGQGNNAPVIVPLATSTINNTIVATRADIKANVGAGIVATWNGQVTTDASGYLVKQGAGTLVLNHGGSSAGAVMVDGGTLLINGGMGGSGVAVNSGATLGGSGHVDQEVLVNAGGTLVATANAALSAGKLTLAGGTLASSVDFASGAGMIDLGGGFSIGAGSALQLDLANLPGPGFARTYMLVSNGGHDAINGTFASINGLGDLPTGYAWSVNYAFSGKDSLGRIGDGNDLALSISAVPEPSTYAMFALGGAMLFLTRRRRASREL
jgi:autotransporter-associated beta strand protein